MAFEAELLLHGMVTLRNHLEDADGLLGEWEAGYVRSGFRSIDAIRKIVKELHPF